MELSLEQQSAAWGLCLFALQHLALGGGRVFAGVLLSQSGGYGF